MELNKTFDRANADAGIDASIRRSRYINRGLAGMAVAAGLTCAATQPAEDLGNVFLGTTAAMAPISGYASLSYRRRAAKIIAEYGATKQNDAGDMAGSPHHYTTLETKWCGVFNEEILVENRVYDENSNIDTDMNVINEVLTGVTPYLLNIGALIAGSGITSYEVAPTAIALTVAAALLPGRELLLISQRQAYQDQLNNIDGRVETLYYE